MYENASDIGKWIETSNCFEVMGQLRKLDNLTRFLQFLEIRGIHAWENLHPNIITGFVEA
jgi:hypothetical protein